MARNPITTTGNVTGEGQAPKGVDDRGQVFPESARGGESEGPRSVKAEYEALVRAAAPDADLGNVLSVTLVNDKVRVEYVDREQASEFEPDPIRVVSASTV